MWPLRSFFSNIFCIELIAESTLFGFCFCQNSKLLPACQHIKVTFKRAAPVCLCGRALSGDSNKNGGAIPCRLLMLIGSDLWGKKQKQNMASVQDKAASDGAVLEELCHKITFWKIKEGKGSRMNTNSHFGTVHTAYGMKIITPRVNQTGEVRLLSKLLNQKVDTACCMRSRGKTLTVQGLWVCKETGILLEMHLQAQELLTFRYAYTTVINQSKHKMKKEKKMTEAVLFGWTLASTILFPHLQFMSSHYQKRPPPPHPAAWPPPPHRKNKGAPGPQHIFYLTFTWRWPTTRQVFDAAEELVLIESRQS